MNNNLEFENEDPSPDSIEDNHPRTNYGEGFSKQETLEEAAENYAEIYRCPATNYNEYCKHDIISAINFGSKWQQERMYSEEEVLKLVDGAFHMYASSYRQDAREWLVEQFKKK